MSEELKSYGEIACNAWESHDRCDKWSAVAAAVRAAVIERECLKEGWRDLTNLEPTQPGDRFFVGGLGYRDVLPDDVGKPAGSFLHVQRRCLFPAPEPVSSIWHWTAEQEPEARDAGQNGRVLTLDAGGSLGLTHWGFATADQVVQWCKVEDFYKACPPLVREERDIIRECRGILKENNIPPVPDTSTLAGKIAVMQAALEGAEIEWRSRSLARGSDRWHPPVEASGGKILWNWIGCEYRVKPEPDPFAAFMAEHYPDIERGSDDWVLYNGIWLAGHAAAKGGAE